MADIAAYCDFVEEKSPRFHPLHKTHHDNWHGFPCRTDDELFGRLILEINQAGLSWLTMLKKEEGFYRAFDRFNIQKIARYGAREKRRLLADAGIIRNRLKIDAVIHNANVVLGLQKEYGSFKGWLDHHHPKPVMEWVKLFRATFKFMGYEVVNEFMMSTGYLPGAHRKSCPIHRKILKHKPAWSRSKR